MLAVNPLIIIEGLVSSHNDLISLSLGIVGAYYLFTKKDFIGRIFFLMSAGIKYLTLSFIILSKQKKLLNYMSFLGIAAGLAYLTFKSEIQPWYFLAVFAFLPFFEEFIGKLNIFWAGLLFSYYPYIYLGGWDSASNMSFSWDTLELNDGGSIFLSGGAGSSLYVDNLILNAGSSLDLNGFNLYYYSLTASEGSSYFNGQLINLASNTGGGSQVPEPSTLLLLGSGIAGLTGIRIFYRRPDRA